MNEEAVRKFFETIILPLQGPEVYLVQLQARRKYFNDSIGHDPVCSRTCIRTNSFNRFWLNIRKIWVATAYGISDKDEQIIPDYAFVLYIDINPKSFLKAHSLYISESMRRIDEYNENYRHHSYPEESQQARQQLSLEVKLRKLDTLMYSCLMRSNSRLPYLMLDLDVPEHYQTIMNCIRDEETKTGNKMLRWVSKTHGGYHFLLWRENLGNLYKQIQATGIRIKQKKDTEGEFDIEFKKQAMTPIPGTLQGGIEVTRIII